MMKKAISILEVLLVVLSILLLLWVGISWIEVISKNLSPNPTYSPVNFFGFLF